ncbi:MAG TPA: hypothetical protein VHX66_14790 [Solirubrobacteraceae bacterium]|nr:hypothetical protein [Solirubrobacteraceae bacterium]
MSERTSVAFADPGAAVEGVAIAGAGALIVRDGELSAAAAPEIEERSLRVADVCDLALEPLAPAGELSAQGVTIWLCSAKGAVAGVAFDGLAALTRRPERVAPLERSAAILFGPASSFVLAASAPPGAGGHGDEEIAGLAFRGEPLAAEPLDRTRISTTYDAAGLARHAGIELWESEDAEFPLRIGGEALTGGELAHPGGERTRVAFLAWHSEAHHAVGVYTITTTD